MHFLGDRKTFLLHSMLQMSVLAFREIQSALFFLRHAFCKEIIHIKTIFFNIATITVVTTTTSMWHMLYSDTLNLKL
jgi:hypothetical protein